MARTRRIKSEAVGTAYYHLMSRTNDAPSAGSVPEGRLMRRVAQIGGGKVFGSEAFVVATAFALGSLFRSRHVSARAVDELGFATHGWRLAKEAVA